MLNDPRNDFASGVRELATTTASLMDGSSLGSGARMLGLLGSGASIRESRQRAPWQAQICSVFTRPGEFPRQIDGESSRNLLDLLSCQQLPGHGIRVALVGPGGSC